MWKVGGKTIRKIPPFRLVMWPVPAPDPRIFKGGGLALADAAEDAALADVGLVEDEGDVVEHLMDEPQPVFSLEQVEWIGEGRLVPGNRGGADTRFGRLSDDLATFECGSKGHLRLTALL